MTIYFYLKKNVPELEQPIMCRIQCGSKIVTGKRKPDIATFATKVICTLEEWDKEYIEVWFAS